MAQQSVLNVPNHRTALEREADATAARSSLPGTLERPHSTAPGGVPLPPASRQAARAIVDAPDRVRLHAGSAATAIATEHHALAVTRGDDIYFGPRAPLSGQAFSLLLLHELAHVAQTHAHPGLASTALAKFDPDEERAIAVDRIKSTIIDAFHDPSSLRDQGVDMLLAASVRLERDAETEAALTARSAARALLAIFDELQRRAETAPRGEDGALMYESWIGVRPWTADRVRTVEQIPRLDPSHLSRWLEIANSEDPYQAPVEGTIRRKQVVASGPEAAPTYTRFRIDPRKRDPNTPVVFYDEHTLVKTQGMSFRTDEGRAIIYAKVIRRVERMWYREHIHSEPRYTVEEELEKDAKALETARKLSAKYRPPMDKSAEQYEEEFDKRAVGSLFTIEVWPSFYAELDAHGVLVPDSLMYSWARKKPEGDTSSLWRPMLPSATLEERLHFAWRQLQFAQKHATAHRYRPGSLSKDGLMFLYQASGEDMVYLFPDGRIMVVNERALLLEAFRQGVLAAAGAVMLGYCMIALAVAVAAAPLAVEAVAAAGSAAQSLYLYALTNPLQALVLAEFTVSTGLTILDIGFDGFLESLKTPQGAAMLLMEILTFKAAGGGRPRMPAPSVHVEEPAPMPRMPSRPGANVLHVETEAPASTLARRAAPIEVETETPSPPRSRTPVVEAEPETTGATPKSRPQTRAGVVEPEPEPGPTTAAKTPGQLEPDEGMHEGKPTYGKPVDVDIDGDAHELIVSKEKDGKPRVRLCSESCDFVVKKLKDARDSLEDTPENAPARARLDDLIDEGERIDKEFASKADRESRKRWDARLEGYRDKLSAAADQYPDQIGDSLKGVLAGGKPLLKPGDVGYAGTIKLRSWKLVPKGAGAHLFERANVKGRPAFAKMDQKGTPRYYPKGSPQNAGQAHLRLHDATDAAGIELGGSKLTDDQIISAYRKAYSDPGVEGIKGDLRLPNGTAIAPDVTPAEAFEALLEWAKRP